MENRDLDAEIHQKLKTLVKSQRRSGILYALIPLAIIFVALMIFWSQLEKRDRNLDKKEQQLAISQQKLEQEKIAVKQKRDSIDALFVEVGKRDGELLQLQSAVNIKDLPRTDKVSALYEKIKQKEKAGEKSGQMQETNAFNKKNKVVYYQQESDAGKVINALHALGMTAGVNYEVLSSKITYNGGPVNTVNYGSKVDKNSLHILVLQLIKEGFDIRSMEPYTDEKDRANVITILRKSKMSANPPLTTEIILKK